MATQVEVNHDSSTTIGDHWDTVTDGEAAFTVTTTAALASSTNGLQTDVDQGGTSFVTKTTSGPGSNELRFRFRSDETNVANLPLVNHSASEFIWEIELTDLSDHLVRFRIAWNASAQLVYVVTKLNGADGESEVELVSDTVISAAEHCFECRLVRESSGVAADGEIEILVDTVQVFQDTSQQNFSTFAALDTIQLTYNSGTGAASITGNSFFDEIIIDDVDTAALGCVGVFSGFDLVLGGGQS